MHFKKIAMTLILALGLTAGVQTTTSTMASANEVREYDVTFPKKLWGTWKRTPTKKIQSEEVTITKHSYTRALQLRGKKKTTFHISEKSDGSWEVHELLFGSSYGTFVFDVIERGRTYFKPVRHNGKQAMAFYQSNGKLLYYSYKVK